MTTNIIELFEIKKIKQENGQISFIINNKEFSAEIDYSLLLSQRINTILDINVYVFNDLSKDIAFYVWKDDFLKKYQYQY